jgi:hypothetical protein
LTNGHNSSTHLDGLNRRDRFRLYSVATMVILVAAGAVTSLDASRVNADLPTPWIGLWERVNIGVWLLWVVALAIAVAQGSPRSGVPLPRDERTTG